MIGYVSFLARRSFAHDSVFKGAVLRDPSESTSLELPKALAYFHPWRNWFSEKTPWFKAPARKRRNVREFLLGILCTIPAAQGPDYPDNLSPPSLLTDRKSFFEGFWLTAPTPFGRRFFLQFVLVDRTAAVGSFYSQHAIYYCCRATNADPDGNGPRRAIASACSTFDTGIPIGNPGFAVRYLENPPGADGLTHSASGARLAVQLQSHHVFEINQLAHSSPSDENGSYPENSSQSHRRDLSRDRPPHLLFNAGKRGKGGAPGKIHGQVS